MSFLRTNAGFILQYSSKDLLKRHYSISQSRTCCVTSKPSRQKCLRLCTPSCQCNPHVSFRNMSVQTAKTLPKDSIMNVFDRQAKVLQRERAGRAPDVQLFDYLKDEVGFRLSDRIFDIKRKFPLVADLGCGRGYVAKHVAADAVEELILCDSCETWLNQAVVTDQQVKVQRKVVDEESLPFEPGSLDLVISSLSLHWVNDLPGTFAQIISSLRADGVFLAAMFGGDTLFELRCALQLAELERHGGLAAHVSPFTEIRDVGRLMTRAGFTMQTVDTDEIVVGYPSMFELMQDIKGMGESNAARNRKLRLNRDTLFAAASIYQSMYGSEEGGKTKVPATFQVIYMLGWKPDKSQPQPLQRGTGDVSLKDLYRIDEIVSDTKKIPLEETK